ARPDATGWPRRWAGSPRGSAPRRAGRRIYPIRRRSVADGRLPHPRAARGPGPQPRRPGAGDGAEDGHARLHGGRVLPAPRRGHHGPGRHPRRQTRGAARPVGPTLMDMAPIPGLRALRERAGLMPGLLGRKAKTPPSVILRAERGAAMAPTTIKALAEALGVTPEDLVEGTPPS